jgi:hypothetical protein
MKWLTENFRSVVVAGVMVVLTLAILFGIVEMLLTVDMGSFYHE